MPAREAQECVGRSGSAVGAWRLDSERFAAQERANGRQASIPRRPNRFRVACKHARSRADETQVDRASGHNSRKLFSWHSPCLHVGRPRVRVVGDVALTCGADRVSNDTALSLCMHVCWFQLQTESARIANPAHPRTYGFVAKPVPVVSATCAVRVRIVRAERSLVASVIAKGNDAAMTSGKRPRRYRKEKINSDIWMRGLQM